MNVWKWTKCFIAWEDAMTGKVNLSVIPWHVFLIGLISDNGNFKWTWVPPWKIKIGF